MYGIFSRDSRPLHVGRHLWRFDRLSGAGFLRSLPRRADYGPPNGVPPRGLAGIRDDDLHDVLTLCQQFPRDLARERGAASPQRARAEARSEALGRSGAIERDPSVDRRCLGVDADHEVDAARLKDRPGRRGDDEALGGHGLAVDEVVHRDQIEGSGLLRPGRCIPTHDVHSADDLSLIKGHPRNDCVLSPCADGTSRSKSSAPSGAKNCIRVLETRSTSVNTAPNPVTPAGTVGSPGTLKKTSISFVLRAMKSFGWLNGANSEPYDGLMSREIHRRSGRGAGLEPGAGRAEKRATAREPRHQIPIEDGVGADATIPVSSSPACT
jgi:hypothetical protein